MAKIKDFKGDSGEKLFSKKVIKNSKKYLQKRVTYDIIFIVRSLKTKTFGSLVKRLRHRPFTAVTRVRFP